MLVTLPRRQQLVLATMVRSTVLAPVLGLQSNFANLRDLRTRLAYVRSERDSLSAELLTLRNVDEENRRLRLLLELSQRQQGNFLPANLYPTGRAGEVVRRSFVVDLGATAGVEAEAPVVAPDGLVGVVRAATRGQAAGDFWTHPEFRVSAMTADGSVFGIVQPAGTSPSLMMLEGAPYQVELAAGTELVTSGLGGVFPRGVPIGWVVELTAAEEGWAKSYLVRPAVNPAAVREVMVLVGDRADSDLADLWERALGGQP